MFPITDPLLVFAFLMACTFLVPLLARRLRLPVVAVMIVAGIAFGPHGSGVIGRDAIIELFGGMGLLFILFIAGLELDLAGFRRRRHESVIFGTLTFLVPLGIGIALGLLLFGFALPAAVLLGSIFASHTLVTYPIATRLGIVRRPVVTAAVGGTLITDIAALAVLAVIAGTAQGVFGPWEALRLAGASVAVVLGTLLFLPRLGTWFFGNYGDEDQAQFLFVLVSVFGVAFLAELAGLEPLVGAFLAGIALNNLVPGNSPLMNRIRFIGETLFVPVFLFSIGMLVDLANFVESHDSLVAAAALSLAVIVGKMLAAQGAGYWLGYGRAERALLFGLSLPQAAATLAAVLVGYRIGLFGQPILDGTVVMILSSCLVGSLVTEGAGRRVALSEAAETPSAASPGQRLLLAVGDMENARRLLECALLLLDRGEDPALAAVTVIPEAPDTAAAVARAERLLDQVALLGSGTVFDVTGSVRIDLNPVRGILRAASEQRATTVLAGWSSQHYARFGNTVLTQLSLQAGRLRVVACRVRQALSTTRRVLLVVPPLSHREPGFPATLSLVKQFALQAGATLYLKGVAADAIPLGRVLESTRPTLTAEVAWHLDWASLRKEALTAPAAGDLPVILAAGTRSISWQAGIDRLPRLFAERHPENSFLVVYHPHHGDGREPDGGFPGFDRVIYEPGRLSLREAVKRLLGEEAGDASGAERRLAELLAQAVPLAPGVVLYHQRRAGLARPRCLFGSFPAQAEPLLVVLLEPVETDPAAHLALLSALVRLLKAPGVVARLRRAGSERALRERLLQASQAAPDT